MEVKQPIDTITEDMRVLNNAVAGDLNTSDSWVTHEFWAMAAGSVANIVAVLVLMGWVGRTQADGLVVAITAIIGATELIVVNSSLIWKYLTTKAAVKAQMIESRYRYMEYVTVERMRMNNTQSTNE